jgi:ATP-dependent Lhr-like helicase
MDSLEETKNVTLPTKFDAWFASKGWAPRRHQMELVEAAQGGKSVLLIAPTGGGKTLAGFLPSLIEIAGDEKRRPGERPHRIHTLYISPLKALAVDIARNLETPIAEMELDVRVETRTGDTPSSRRQRQRRIPPDMLLTTPEQLALLLAYKDSAKFFGSLKCVILDELHALQATKRGDLLALGLARLETFSPGYRRIGLSATVAEPDILRAYLTPQKETAGEPFRVGAANEHGASLFQVAKESGARSARDLSELVMGEGGVAPQVAILRSEAHIPWSGHSSRYALPDVYNAIQANQTSLVFVNTRSQAEIIFQELWRLNEESLPIALHHGSLSVEQRRKVEAAMAVGSLRAVVCTSTLDLGVDWGDVDLVIHVGAPKGASRLLQRIGRANHRLDEPSRALLVPSNRFEVLECEAARQAAINGVLDGGGVRVGGLDVLAQHVLGVACAETFDPDALFTEVISAEPYVRLDRETFDKIVEFVATGGYALRRYDRYHRLTKTDEGYRVAHPRIAQQYRMNVGTIVEAPMVKVRVVKKARAGGRLSGGRIIGQIEEWFVDQLAIGDTFLFGGQILAFQGLVETEAIAVRAASDEPMIPSYMGGKFPLSTYLAESVRKMLADPAQWENLPPQVEEWLNIQKWRSVLPRADQMLVETFPRGHKHYLVCYPFDGRLAHQSLGMLVTRRLERIGAAPLGFIASEYALAIWSLRDMSKLSMATLFDEDMLGDDLDAWLQDSSLLKRTFRNCAIISGLIERRYPGQEKTGRQMTVSSDLIYDVLREHEPDHILMRATNHDAATGLLDIGRLGELLRRVKDRIVLRKLDRVSPLAVPVLLDIGKVPVYGEASEELLAEATDSLIEEAMRTD